MRRQPPFGLGTSPSGEEIKFSHGIATGVTLSLAICSSRSLVKVAESSVADERLLLKICCLGLVYPIRAPD